MSNVEVHSEYVPLVLKRHKKQSNEQWRLLFLALGLWENDKNLLNYKSGNRLLARQNVQFAKINDPEVQSILVYIDRVPYFHY